MVDNKPSNQVFTYKIIFKDGRDPMYVDQNTAAMVINCKKNKEFISFSDGKKYFGIDHFDVKGVETLDKPEEVYSYMYIDKPVGSIIISGDRRSVYHVKKVHWNFEIEKAYKHSKKMQTDHPEIDTKDYEFQVIDQYFGYYDEHHKSVQHIKKILPQDAESLGLTFKI